MHPISNFLVKQLELNGERLTADGEYLYLNGEPLLTSALSVIITGDQYIQGLKEFESANINSGIVRVNGLDTELKVLRSEDGEWRVHWEDNTLLFSGLATLDWGDRVLRSGNSVPELGVSLDWNQRILSGNWKTVYPEGDADIATKEYVDDRIAALEGSLADGIRVPIQSGVDRQYVSYPNVGEDIIVTASMESSTGDWIYSHLISGVTPTGCHVLFSDYIDSDDYYLNIALSTPS